METESTLEDSSSLPGVINIKKFVSVRLEEMKSLRDAIENPKRTAMVFQQLPKHMRRRVMSYKIKRMPKRLREVHSRLLDKCNAKEPGKRPSRKFRRRPKNLRSEYARRQRKFVWLETHIWHAKRFHMVNRWGYRLPNFPNDKGYRACFRASDQHALLQDISYMICIEIAGTYEEIISKLSALRKEGASFSAVPYRNGAREGESLVMNPSNSKPFGIIKFLWSGPEEEPRKLWIWVHPSFYSDIYECLLDQFKSTNVAVTSLKDEFVRFKLTGPKSLAVVATCLSASTNTPWVKEGSPPEEDTSSDVIMAESNVTVEDLTGRLSLADEAEHQKEFFSKFCQVQSHNEVCPRAVLYVTVKVTIPTRKEAFRIRDVDFSETVDRPSSHLSNILWSKTGRQAVKEYMLSRPKNPEIPVIIIQNPNNERGYGGGLDLIAGSGCGMPLLLALVHSGGRCGGLRETSSMELFSFKSPMLPLDSIAGGAEDARVSSENTETYFRLPPAKRRNYIKLGVSCPFQLNWKQLSDEWNGPLVRVRLEAIGRGTFPRCSIICIPLASDKPGDTIEESPKEDLFEAVRKELRKSHQLKLRQLARARKRARIVQDEKKLAESCSAKIVADYNREMRDLWIPPVKELRTTLSREVGGFVSAGGHHPGMGKGLAIGYLAAPAMELLTHHVLIHQPDSPLYRWATFTVI